MNILNGVFFFYFARYIDGISLVSVIIVVSSQNGTSRIYLGKFIVVTAIMQGYFSPRTTMTQSSYWNC